MLFLVLVVAPFLMTLEDLKERARIYQVVGKTFRFWGWVAILLLLFTGFFNLHLMGFPPTSLLDPSFYTHSFGKALGIKLSLVFIIVVSSIFHDFLFGPGARENQTYGMIARWIGRFNLLIALVIVFLAVSLRLGGI